MLLDRHDAPDRAGPARDLERLIERMAPTAAAR